jgi:hypothetical protein
MKVINLTKIPDSVILDIGQHLKLKWLYPVVILENPKIKPLGVLRYDWRNEICVIMLKDGSDQSSLAHELRHLWQMEKLSPEMCQVIYHMEQKLGGHHKNILENDAYEWESYFYKKYKGKSKKHKTRK